METKITYFENPGKENTDAVMRIVKTRAQELGINMAVVASFRGYTAEKAVRVLDNMKIVVIAGFAQPTMQNLEETFSQGDENLIRSKATILTTTHFFSGMSRAIRKKYNNSSPEETVAQALRIISVGVKVGIECTIMAADAGLVHTDEDIIAIGGTRSGADTALVIRPVNSQDFFDIKVKEILCKPRNW
ncbi:pyruvate kinase alpha/beta domain-containing protein [Chloroflexota bacterium]